ncbi:MAG: type II toxin-antitoxin system VapC family toxin [Actinobacteria bacterium]|nr:type II toxin-antitoxin system VapC family toxin [Actinomycetota bacterium]
MTRTVYCDASVLIKRTGEESDSDEVNSLIHGFTAESATLITSTLAQVEVRRALNRVGLASDNDDGGDDYLLATLGGIHLAVIDADVLDLAGRIPTQHLGTLDSIHLATALLSHADVMLTRDNELARACEAVGLAVA